MYLNSTSTQTCSGRAFDFAAPDPRSVCIEDIATVFWRMPRWNGHLTSSWNLGQHSLLVLALLESQDAEIGLQALLHDASEAYTGDLPGPLKRLLGESYKSVERGIEAVIAARFGIGYPWSCEVKRADRLAQDIEATMFMSKPLPGLVREGFALTERHESIVRYIIGMERADFLAVFECLVWEKNKAPRSRSHTLSAIPVIANA